MLHMRDKSSFCEDKNLIKMGKARFSFIDLFAGIGGMRIGFESCGGSCVFSSELNKFSQLTYYQNFGVVPVGDITVFDEEEIPNHDILVAGFPCQPFSLAGVSKKKSMGKKTGFLDITQGTLFFDIIRILNAKRPKAFLLENVKNLKSHDKGNTWRIVLDSLNELDYQIFPVVLDAQDFVPQHRERIFIVGFDKRLYKKEISFSYEIDIPQIKPQLRDILLPIEEVDPKYILSDKLWNYLQAYSLKHKLKGNGFGYGLANPSGISRTLSARYHKDGSEILIPRGFNENPRRLTPRECARLQGFPEDFKIPVSDTQAYRQFGNSVAVPLVSAIAELIINKLEELA